MNLLMFNVYNICNCWCHMLRNKKMLTGRFHLCVVFCCCCCCVCFFSFMRAMICLLNEACSTWRRDVYKKKEWNWMRVFVVADVYNKFCYFYAARSVWSGVVRARSSLSMLHFFFFFLFSILHTIVWVWYINGECVGGWHSFPWFLF